MSYANAGYLGPKKRTCHRCGEAGHLTADCPASKGTGKSKRAASASLSSEGRVGAAVSEATAGPAEKPGASRRASSEPARPCWCVGGPGLLRDRR
eukprot:9746609-Alexandrium_andersonii.AAC.1